MQLTLQDNEIKRAVIDYIDSQGINTIGKHIDVSIVNGRKTGLSATVSINDPDTPTPDDDNSGGDGSIFGNKG